MGKLNGTAKWIGLALVVGGIIYNAGVTINKLNTLSTKVDTLTTSVSTLDGKIDAIHIQLALRHAYEPAEKIAGAGI